MASLESVCLCLKSTNGRSSPHREAASNNQLHGPEQPVTTAFQPHVMVHSNNSLSLAAVQIGQQAPAVVTAACRHALSTVVAIITDSTLRPVLVLTAMYP